MNPPNPASSESCPAALEPSLIAALRDGYTMDAADRACHNAVANNDLASLALNREAMNGGDDHFSHRIKPKGVANQKKSGTCWMFAALNVMRPQVIRDFGMEDFEFSTSYLQFWDKMERANLFFESVIELRDADFLDREWQSVTQWAFHDGGWWSYVSGLIEKYGVVPRAVMSETHGSANTATLNEVLGRLARVHAVRLLDRHAEGRSVAELRAEKRVALDDIYRFLVINFGAPPSEFDWRYRRDRDDGHDGDGGECAETGKDSSHEADLTPPERHTPLSFYRKFVKHRPSDYVTLYNDPKNEFDRHYQFRRARNMVGSESMSFVNIDSATMKRVAIASIVANEALWFAVNMSYDQSTEHGLMEHGLFDYEALFGIELTIRKADRARFHAGVSNHAMVLTGVDLDADGAPVKWQVENSWGEEKGKKGYWTMRDRWFDEHVYVIIVHRDHVPAEILERFEQPAVDLPAWYPGAPGVG